MPVPISIFALTIFPSGEETPFSVESCLETSIMLFLNPILSFINASVPDANSPEKTVSAFSAGIDAIVRFSVFVPSFPYMSKAIDDERSNKKVILIILLFKTQPPFKT